MITTLFPFCSSQIAPEAHSFSVVNQHTQIFLWHFFSHLVLHCLLENNNFHSSQKPSAIKHLVCFHSSPHTPCMGRTGHYLYLDNVSLSCVSREFHQSVPTFYTQGIKENVKTDQSQAGLLGFPLTSFHQTGRTCAISLIPAHHPTSFLSLRRKV